MAKLPEPPAGGLKLPAETVTLAARTPLARIYFVGGRHPAAWNGFRYFGPTASRFDHHDPPPAVSKTKAILYAARDATTCLAEVFQATRVIDRTLDAPWLAVFETTRDLTLLDLTGAWPTRAGASMAINSGPRPRARRWSQAIHAAYPGVEGILHASSMHANKPAVALYERAQNALASAPSFNRALSDAALAPSIGTAATTLGYRIV
jgi:hypothetical protein